MIKIRKDDRVEVIAGEDIGKRGTILKVFPKKGRAIVEGVNFIKRHTKARGTQQGGILEREASVQVSNLMLVCPKCDSRVSPRVSVLSGGKRARACRKCGEMISSA